MTTNSEPETVYTIRRPEVVSEVFEGEAVVVDLKQGRYYAFSPLGSAVWSRLESAPSLDELAAAASASFDGRGGAREAVTPFVESLVDAGLVVRGQRAAGGAPAELEPITAAGDDRSLTFETYTDLEDLLVLDPIHELDESGWPLPPETSED